MQTNAQWKQTRKGSEIKNLTLTFGIARSNVNISIYV